MVACPRVAHLGRHLLHARCPQLERHVPLRGICGGPPGPPRPVLGGPKGRPSPRGARAQDLGPLGPGTRPSGPSPTAPPFGGWGGELESARQLARASQLRPGTRCSAQNGWKTGRGEASGPAEAGWAPSTAAAGWSLPEPAACAPCCWSQRPHPTLPAAGGRRARDGRLWCSDGRSSGLRRARATTEDSWGRPSPSGSVTVAQAGGQAGRAAQGCCCCC